MKNIFKLLYLSSALLSLSSIAAQFPVTITDVAGRQVTIESQPENIALSTGHIFPLLEILYQQKAADHLVAWRDDMRLSAPSMYANYIKDFPQLKTVPHIGKIKSGIFGQNNIEAMQK